MYGLIINNHNIIGAVIRSMNGEITQVGGYMVWCPTINKPNVSMEHVAAMEPESESPLGQKRDTNWQCDLGHYKSDSS